MHYSYEIVCDNIEDFNRLVTEKMIDLYERHKHDERIFPKDRRINELNYKNKQE